jgi:hypothetical protein
MPEPGFEQSSNHQSATDWPSHQLCAHCLAKRAGEDDHVIELSLSRPDATHFLLDNVTVFMPYNSKAAFVPVNQKGVAP